MSNFIGIADDTEKTIVIDFSMVLSFELLKDASIVVVYDDLNRKPEIFQYSSCRRASECYFQLLQRNIVDPSFINDFAIQTLS